jgi:hypothetical protein
MHSILYARMLARTYLMSIGRWPRCNGRKRKTLRYLTGVFHVSSIPLAPLNNPLHLVHILDSSRQVLVAVVRDQNVIYIPPPGQPNQDQRLYPGRKGRERGNNVPSILTPPTLQYFPRTSLSMNLLSCASSRNGSIMKGQKYI